MEFEMFHDPIGAFRRKADYKNDNPKVMVDFNLWGEFIDFDEFNRLLHVEPTKTKKKAEYKVSEYAHDTWELSSGYVETMAISVPFEALTSQLSREINQINCLKEKYCLHSNLIAVIKSHINENARMYID